MGQPTTLDRDELVPFEDAARWARKVAQYGGCSDYVRPIYAPHLLHDSILANDRKIQLYEYADPQGRPALAFSSRQLHYLQTSTAAKSKSPAKVYSKALNDARLQRLPLASGQPVTISSTDALLKRLNFTTKKELMLRGLTAEEKEAAVLWVKRAAEGQAKRIRSTPKQLDALLEANAQSLPTPPPSSAESTPEPVLKKRRRERPAPPPSRQAPATPAASSGSPRPPVTSFLSALVPSAVSPPQRTLEQLCSAHPVHVDKPSASSSEPVASRPSSVPPPRSTSSSAPVVAHDNDAKAAGLKQFELATLRHAYVQAQEKGGAAFVALDVEFWERDHNVLLEFGWSIADFGEKKKKNGKVKVRREDQHVVIKENKHRRNGRFAPDARDHFSYGRTLTLPTNTLYLLLSALFSTLSATQPVFLIFHDPRGDIRSLNRLGFDSASDFQTDLRKLVASQRGPDEAGQVWVVDTQRLFEAWIGRKFQVGLERACVEVQVPTRKLHNAGNDAHYTLDLFERLMDPSRTLSTSSTLIQTLDAREAQFERRKMERVAKAQEKKEQEVLAREAGKGSNT
ncbi:hypothetical protein JCM11641_001865 [Rhodosporidiobolus odoratus]